MKVDLGVTSSTANDYDDAITKLDDIKGRIQQTLSTLSDKGWDGEAKDKYNELVKWFLSKDYECLQENLKCIRDTLVNDLKSKGAGLKNRCEDFVNCLDGSEIGMYPESDGEVGGILSLEYDNTAGIIDNITEITNRQIVQKRAALNDLSKTIKGGFFSSGLIFSSLNIDNELAESFNEISKEEKGLNAFQQSFAQYTLGVKGLEQIVSNDLSKVKDLESTVLSEKSINNIDTSVKLGTFEKVEMVAKTVVIDVGEGAHTCFQGLKVVGISLLLIPASDGLSGIGVPEGFAMIVSGGNTAFNGGRDFIREINGEWAEVGSTNLVKDELVDTLEKFVNKETAETIGSSAITGIDIFGSARGMVGAASYTINTGKDSVNGVNSLYNDYKLLGTSYKIINIENNETKVAKLINVEGLKNSASKIGGLAYNDTVQYYNGKTIVGDVTPLLGVQNEQLPNAIAIDLWLKNDD